MLPESLKSQSRIFNKTRRVTAGYIWFGAILIYTFRSIMAGNHIMKTAIQHTMNSTTTTTLSKTARQHTMNSTTTATLSKTAIQHTMNSTTTTTLSKTAIQHTMNSTTTTTLSLPKYKILCTTDNRLMKWGSFQIRCRDLRTWAERCAKGVQITTLSHEELLQQQPNQSESINQQQTEELVLELEVFNATVSIKKPLFREPRFGRMFVDVVDEYWLPSAKLGPGVEVIVQNEYHAHDKFRDRKFHVVEHWYNSFPLDMVSDSDDDSNTPTSFPLPQIRAVNAVEMATIWTNKDDHSCPKFLQAPSDVNYHCITELYFIETWYQNYFNTSDFEEMKRLEMLLADPNQGPGRIYYELFWKYDVLVVPVKTETKPKLRYGNVQRAVSQMRSGVPVLLEVYGEVLEDFMAKYNYTCAYVMYNRTLVSKPIRRYWTFEEAAEAMKSVAIRRQCQEEGLQIVRDYSPNEIAKKHLRALGYEGGFQCDSANHQS
eukprot:scaffold535_cov65-Cylindrotheca_fusiformis.AAC.14